MENEIHYSIIRSELVDAYIGSYITYGICADIGGNLMIPDVSTDYEDVMKLVARMNVERIEPCHMYDVVYDFVASH